MKRLEQAILDIAPQWNSTADNSKVDELGKVRAILANTGYVTVWSGKSDKSIWSDIRVNLAFRAWHDYIHIINDFPFTFEGELRTYVEHCKQLRAIYGVNNETEEWCHLLYAEIMGQLEYKELHGDFPEEQRQFVRDYMANPVSALMENYS